MLTRASLHTPTYMTILHTDRRTDRHTRAHAPTFIHTYMTHITCIHTDTHVYTGTRTHTHTIHAHARQPAHINAHITYTHTHTHTHTHLYINTYSSVLSSRSVIVLSSIYRSIYYSIVHGSIDIAQSQCRYGKQQTERERIKKNEQVYG